MDTGVSDPGTPAWVARSSCCTADLWGLSLVALHQPERGRVAASRPRPTLCHPHMAHPALVAGSFWRAPARTHRASLQLAGFGNVASLLLSQDHPFTLASETPAPPPPPENLRRLPPAPFRVSFLWAQHPHTPPSAHVVGPVRASTVPSIAVSPGRPPWVSAGPGASRVANESGRRAASQRCFRDLCADGMF